MTDDADLLRRYAETGLESAFSEFVARHFGLVYGTALRGTNNAELAREAAQSVFTDVARRASVLSRHAALAAWLYTASRHAASNLLRAERRRRQREQVAYEMSTTHEPSNSAADWARLQPVIDAAMGALSCTDREAVLVRYFENRPFAEIAARLSVSESGARMRVERALERLRRVLERRGVESTSAALAVALAEQAGAAPAGLATEIAQAAMAASALSGVAVGGLTLFAMNKLIVAGIAAMVVGAFVPSFVEWREQRALSAELSRLRSESAQVVADTHVPTVSSAHMAPSTPDQARLGELKRLQARVATLKARPDGVVDAEMKPPTNAGSATPESAFETLNWSFTHEQWDVLSAMIVLEGEAKQKADAFFAGLTPEVRERYGTPERFLAQAWIAGTTPKGGWAASVQTLESEIMDGPISTRRVRVWQRTSTGVEFGSICDFELRPPRGWMISASAMNKVLPIIISKLDPVTGANVQNPVRPL